MVDEQLRTAALEVERARQNQAAAAAEVERLARHDAEIASQLAQAHRKNTTVNSNRGLPRNWTSGAVRRIRSSTRPPSWRTRTRRSTSSRRASQISAP